MPQRSSLVPLICEPIRVNVFSIVTYNRGSSQYPEQTRYCTENNLLPSSLSAMELSPTSASSFLSSADSISDSWPASFSSGLSSLASSESASFEWTESFSTGLFSSILLASSTSLVAFALNPVHK